MSREYELEYDGLLLHLVTKSLFSSLILVDLPNGFVWWTGVGVSKVMSSRPDSRLLNLKIVQRSTTPRRPNPQCETLGVYIYWQTFSPVDSTRTSQILDLYDGTRTSLFSPVGLWFFLWLLRVPPPERLLFLPSSICENNNPFGLQVSSPCPPFRTFLSSTVWFLPWKIFLTTLRCH